MRNSFGDFSFSNLISTSLGLGFSDSDARADPGNDAETYDFSLGINFAFPWAFVSVSSAHSFNDYKRADTSIDSNTIRSDYSNTLSIGLTKAVGDLLPALDPNRRLFINLSYEEVESESNILKAAETFSLLAPPPTSKKFAGSSPYNLIISIVAIANPAPLTMHPILPSNFM